MPNRQTVSPSDVTLPATLRRSPAKAQRTYAKAMADAESRYGKGERAGRTAMAAVKHSFEKVGDHWEPKARKGPSDARAKEMAATRSDARRRNPRTRTAGGVDVEGHSRQALLDRARGLGITGLSRMNKQQLGEAIARRQ